MARCYTLSTTQTRLWLDGDGWDAWRIEEDVIDWTIRYRIKEPVVVVTSTHRIAFAVTAQGERQGHTP
jgi:hypothetical protein